MAGGSDDDLDWLYRRNSHARNVPDPGEHTRAMSEAEERALASRRDNTNPWSGWPDPVKDQERDAAAAARTPTAQEKNRPGRMTFSESPSEPEPPRRQNLGERRVSHNNPPASPPPPVRPRPAAPGPDPEPPRRRRRHPVRNALVTLLVLILAVLGYLIGVPAVAWGNSGKVDDVPAGKRPAQQPGQLYLLVGSDSRVGLTKEQQKKLGTGSVEGQRTDTMMLLYVPPSGEPALISLPRDSFVAIPDHGNNKLNAAFAIDGAKLLEKTVEQNTGLRIDGYMEVGFGGFVNVIDAVGGIRMCPKKAIKDKDSHLDIPAGCQNMDGVTALGYVRMRKADPRGDLGRVERQREMLSALAKKVATPASVVNPVRYWNLNSAVASSLKTGQDTSTFEVGRMGLAMIKISQGKGLTLTVPISNPNASTSAGSAVLWDEAKSKEMFSQIAKGDTSKLKQFAKTN